MACLRSLAACQRHTTSLAAVIGLSNNDFVSLRSLCQFLYFTILSLGYYTHQKICNTKTVTDPNTP